MSRIETDQPFPGMWTAIDADRYDGAPDGDTTMGTGKTKAEAIQDLLDRYEEQSSVYSTNERIEAIFDAADAFWSGKTDERARDRKLSDAIDAAMSHAYAEGRADQLREDRHEAMLAATEKAKAESRLHPVFVDILNSIGGKRAA